MSQHFICEQHGTYFPSSTGASCPACAGIYYPSTRSPHCVVVPSNNPGWTCSLCGRSNAPFVMTCPCFSPSPSQQQSGEQA